MFERMKNGETIVSNDSSKLHHPRLGQIDDLSALPFPAAFRSVASCCLLFRASLYAVTLRIL